MNRIWKIQGHEFPIWWLDRFYREEVLGLTQKEVCWMNHVSNPNLSNYERGIKWSPKIHNCYVDMGSAEWSYTITPERADMLWECYTHKWAIEVNKRKPGCCPIRREWENGTED